MIQNEARAALVIFLMGTALACTPPQPETPAEFCAEAAAIYMGLQLPVSVESENSDAPGSVTVSYQGMDRANIPAKGEATCVFADSAAPGSGVESAVVNGEPLGQHEIEALNRKLASP